MHDQAWHDERRKGIGGSDATSIMAGQWNKLWLNKTGTDNGPDLDGILPVAMGTFTEPFNRKWFTRQTGLAVSTVNCDHLVHTHNRHMRANLDGRLMGAIFEAKHIGQDDTIDNALKKYHWQLIHNMYVADMDFAYLSVFFGNRRWEMVKIEQDTAQLGTLMEWENEFWQHVETGEEPENRNAFGVTPKVNLDLMRDIDMTGNNHWANLAATYLETEVDANHHDRAKKQLKKLVTEDVKSATGHGVTIKRSVSGSLLFK
jgi:predicted phage-related endonuclease|tara:strand:+ start:2351 stop:3127 length:777 start_codon:yes stop_codon:yes gene_type:complete